MPNLETFVSKDPYRQCISFPNLNQSNSDEQELDCQQYLCGWIENFRLFKEKPHVCVESNWPHNGSPHNGRALSPSPQLVVFSIHRTNLKSEPWAVRHRADNECAALHQEVFEPKPRIARPLTRHGSLVSTNPKCSRPIIAPLGYAVGIASQIWLTKQAKSIWKR